MKIFLDDAPERWKKLSGAEPGWTWVQSYQEFCEVLEATLSEGDTPTVVSFDHDLGGVETGYDCAVFFIAALNKHKIPLNTIEIRVHSMNPVGKKRIIDLLQCT